MPKLIYKIYIRFKGSDSSNDSFYDLDLLYNTCICKYVSLVRRRLLFSAVITILATAHKLETKSSYLLFHYSNHRLQNYDKQQLIEQGEILVGLIKYSFLDRVLMMLVGKWEPH